MNVRPTHHFFAISLFLLCAATMTACEPRGPQPVWDPEPDTEPLVFDAVAFGNAVIVDTTEVVIRSQAEWDTLAPQLRTMGALPTDVDFDQWQLVLAALPQETSGFQLRFVTLERKDGELLATYTVEVPEGDCILDPTPNTPYHLILSPRTPGDEPARFVREFHEYNCTFEAW